MAVLYVGGNFTGKLAKWDGSAWSSIGTPNADVKSILYNETEHSIYIGHNITAVDAVGIGRIAKLDVASGVWTSPGTGLAADGGGATLTAAIFLGPDGLVYAVRENYWVANANGVSKLTAGAWQPLSIMGSTDFKGPRCGVFRGEELMVGGSFSSPLAYLARRLVDDSWVSTGYGGGAITAAFVSSAGALYVAHYTTQIVVSKWDGSSWVGLPGLAASSPSYGYAFAEDQTGAIYVCGYNVPPQKWTGAAWELVGGSSITGVGYDIAVDQATGYVYICGTFNSPHSASGVWVFTGSAWEVLGTGSPPSTCFALALGVVTIPSFTATFDAHEGVPEPDPQVAVSGTLLTEPDPSPARAGYTFGSWYSTVKGTIYPDNTWLFITDVITQDMTLEAYYAADEYTVTFDSQGGTAVPAQSGYGYNSAITEPSPRPTRASAGFKGWYKEAACTNLWDFVNDTITADTTLYAGWSGVSRLVLYDSLGGSPSKSTKLEYMYTKITAPTAPTRAGGYAFDGWYKEAACTNAWDFDNDLLAGAMTLYAKWTIPTFTVTFNTNGGSAVADQSIVGGELVRRVSAPAKTGYSFYGWYKEAALTNPWMFPLDIITTNTTLYAKWVTYVDVSERTYIGGRASSTPGYAVRKLTGATSEPVGELSYGYCTCMATMADGNIVAAFQMYHGRTHIKIWDGSVWQPICDYILGAVTSIAIDPYTDDVFVGGWFDKIYIAGVATLGFNGLARWDGTVWNTAGGVSGQLQRLKVGRDGVMYLARTSSTATFIMSWNGTAWALLRVVSGVYLNSDSFDMASGRFGVVRDDEYYRSLGAHAFNPLDLAYSEVVAAAALGLHVSVNGVLLVQTSAWPGNFKTWDGTGAEFFAASGLRVSKYRDFNGGVFFGVCERYLLSFSDEVTRLSSAYIAELALTDMCIAAPTNAPSPDDPDNPVEPEIPDPPAPEDGYTFKSIVFNIVSAPHISAASYQIKPIRFDVIEVLPDAEGYCYRTFYFDVGALAPPIEERGVTSRLIFFDVYGTGEKIPGDEAIIDFSVEAAEDQPALISFNVIGTTIRDFPVSFYINEEIEVASLDMDVSVLASGAITTGGNKSVLVNIFQGDTLIATADGFARVGAGAGLRVDIYGIPNPLASDILVEAYVQNELTYSETLSYSTNLGVTII